ncbi:MAG: ABC transporter permease [Desulfurococcales archaeon]|nr:ABC transporter permease [Desulfurococcales archaeon]
MEVLRYLLRESKTGMAGLAIILAFISMALLANLIAPYDPMNAVLGDARQPPSPQHPLGTDELGRDLLSRIIYGARTTFLIAVSSTFTAFAVGTALGILSGYLRGAVDAAVNGGTQILLSLPGIVIAIIFVALWGPSLVNLIIAIAIGFIPVYIKLMRAATLQVMSMEYIQAAKMLGLSNLKIMVRHVLPNVLPVGIAQLSTDVGFAILTASGLGFLGLGLDPSIPEWGAMIGSAKNYIFVAPHIIIEVGAVIALSAIGFSLLGNALRDYIDPKRR